MKLSSGIKKLFKIFLIGAAFGVLLLVFLFSSIHYNLESYQFFSPTAGRFVDLSESLSSPVGPFIDLSESLSKKICAQEQLCNQFPFVEVFFKYLMYLFSFFVVYGILGLLTYTIVKYLQPRVRQAKAGSRAQIILLFAALLVTVFIYLGKNEKYSVCLSHGCDYEVNFIDRGWPLPVRTLIKASVSDYGYNENIKFQRSEPYLNALMYTANILIFYIFLNILYDLYLKKKTESKK